MELRVGLVRDLLLTYMLLILESIPASEIPVHVDLSTGQIQGTRIHKNFRIGSDAKTHKFEKYLGIAYAKPPIGERRFKPPMPLDVTDEPQMKGKYPRVCPQLSFHPDTAGDHQDENCLYLDIYTPYRDNHKSDTRYPVMVYFHGGSYEVGAGSLYHGGVLAEMGVVVVLINYRLGALGDSLLPGNYGLQDQVASLLWVQDNISKFRGDRNMVTIFGHSVGASSVGLMMIVPQARGLFHRVIAQSGAATAPYSTHSPSNANFTRYVMSVGELFGCEGSWEELLTCLRGVPPQVIIEERGKFPMYDPIDPEFRPFVDGHLLPDIPRKAFVRGNYYKVPIMLGTVKDEFANYFNGGERHRNEFDWALDGYVEKILHRDQALLDVVKFVYTDWTTRNKKQQHNQQETNNNNNNNNNQFRYLRGDLLSDMHMIAPIVDMADIVSRYQKHVYQYHFSLPNSFHSIELNYVFGAPFSGHFADEMTINGTIDDFTEADRNLSLNVMRMWVNFAYKGVPTDKGSPTDWEPYTQENRNYLSLRLEDLSMQRHLRAEKVAFWNNLMPSISRNGSGLVGHSRAWPPEEQVYQAPQVNVWFLLAAVCILLAIVLLLTVLFIKTVRVNQKYRNDINIYVAAHNV